jgi:hypothetical protein
MGTMEAFVRPLSKVERRLLTSALRRRQRRLRNYWKRLLAFGLVVFGSLWIWTLIATHGRWYIVTAIWLAIGSFICAWVYASEKLKEERRLRSYEEALSRNEARVTRIRADEMVELEEVEDESAWYAFQLNDSKMVFVSGAYYDPSARFPNTDFSLIEIYREDGLLTEGFVEKDGEKLKPKRRIPAKVTSKMRFPAHLEIIEGRLDQLEQLLKA